MRSDPRQNREAKIRNMTTAVSQYGACIGLAPCKPHASKLVKPGSYLDLLNQKTLHLHKVQHKTTSNVYSPAAAGRIQQSASVAFVLAHIRAASPGRMSWLLLLYAGGTYQIFESTFFFES